MEVLTLNGQKYVKASKAARDLGYASDYVGQLCRKGTVDAHLVGRTWYVNPETLGAHRVEKKRNARVKAREHARRSIEEAKSLRVKDDTKSYTNVAIRYEGDTKELLPEVRKVTINSYQKKVERTDEPRSEKKYSVENENEKIMMSGTLKVRDAELEEEFTDTTILRPRIMRTPIKTELSTIEADASHTAAVETGGEADQQVPTGHSSFADRVTAITGAEESEEVDQVDAGIPNGSSVRYFVLSTLGVLAVVLSIASLFVATKFAYSEGMVRTTPLLDTTTFLAFVAENKDFSSRLFK